MNRSGRFTEVKSSVTEIEEVLEAKIASFFTMPSSDAYIFFFSSTFSMMASMTMSQSARSDLFVVALEPPANVGLLLDGDPALLNRTFRELCQRFIDPGEALVQKLLLNLEHRDLKSSHSANLRYARSHQPTTENSNLLNFHEIPPYQLNSTRETLSPGIEKFNCTVPSLFSSQCGDSNNCNCPAALRESYCSGLGGCGDPIAFHTV